MGSGQSAICTQIAEHIKVLERQLAEAPGEGVTAQSRLFDLGYENARLREALQQLVTDYEDVPDPTDADGQAVFQRAREALAQEGAPSAAGEDGRYTEEQAQYARKILRAWADQRQESCPACGAKGPNDARDKCEGPSTEYCPMSAKWDKPSEAEPADLVRQKYDQGYP